MTETKSYKSARFSAHPNGKPEDGWYINRYMDDLPGGGVSRSTPYDGLTQKQAERLARVLTRDAERHAEILNRYAKGETR